jgi:hypothetical protein
VLLDLVSLAGNRPAASITLAANSAQNDPAAMAGPVRFGSLSVAAGAAISVDPGAAITLNAARRLTIDGTLEAPGGTITLGLTQASPTLADQTYDPLRAIRLGAQTRLLAPGSAGGLSNATIRVESLSFGPRGGVATLRCAGAGAGGACSKALSEDGE